MAPVNDSAFACGVVRITSIPRLIQLAEYMVHRGYCLQLVCFQSNRRFIPALLPAYATPARKLTGNPAAVFNWCVYGDGFTLCIPPRCAWAAHATAAKALGAAYAGIVVSIFSPLRRGARFQRYHFCES